MGVLFQLRDWQFPQLLETSMLQEELSPSRLFASVALCLCALVGRQTVLAQTFELVDLGTLPGTTNSSARAINDNGLVAGMADDRLFAWEQGTGTRDLAAPYPHDNLYLRLNANGKIAGLWRRGGNSYPFLWEGGSFRELPQPAANWVTSVERLTDGGIVLYRGPGSTPACPATQSAVLFGGVLYDVSSALGGCWDARDVDDGLRIAGSFRYTDLFTYFASTTWSPTGIQTLSDRLPTFQSTLIPNTYQRIGAGGHLAGQQGNLAGRLFVSGPARDYFEVDSPAGAPFFPSAVNLQGEVTANGGRVNQIPYLIRNKRVIDLSAIAAGYTVLFAWDMNRFGHIAATAVKSGVGARAVVIKPTDYPRALQATGSGNQVTVTWTPPPGAPTGSSYLLQVGSTDGASNVFSANMGSSTAITGSVPNGTYFARVRMVYPNGAWSGVSNELRFVVPAPPLGPTSLAYTVSGRRLALSWVPPPDGAVTYVIEAGSQSGASDIFNGNVGGAPGLSADVPSGTYYIRVRAVADGGIASAASNEVVAVVP